MTPEEIEQIVVNHGEILKEHDKKFKEHESVQKQLVQYMKEARDESVKTNEILQAWGDAKGFIKVVSTFGKVVLWTAAIIGALIVFAKYWKF